MRFHRLIALIGTLLLCGVRAAATVTIEPLGASQRIVDANGFHTVGFTVASHDESARTFFLTVDTTANIISPINPIILKPGAPAKIAFTFSWSGEMVAGQTVPFEVTITAVDDPMVTSRASIVFLVESKECAAVGNSGGTVVIKDGKAAEVVFTLTNCGVNQETFDVEADPDYGLELRTRVQPVKLDPGELKTLRFTIASTNSRADYTSSVNVRIIRNQLPLAGIVIPVSVKSAAFEKLHSTYQYIPLTVSLESTLDQNDDMRTALKVSIPYLRDGATTVKSDIWMDSDGEKLETQRQKHEISYHNTRMILGDQPVVLPKNLHNEITNYKGYLLSQPQGGGTLSVFSGGSSTNRVALYKWELPVGPRFLLGLGHLTEKNQSSGFSKITANTISASYLVNKRMSLESEINGIRVSGLTPELSWSGIGLRIGGSYQSDNLQIHGFTQTGRRNVSASDFFRGTELRLDYDINRSRHIFADFQRHAAYAESGINRSMELFDVLNTQQISSIGYSQPFVAGTQLFTSLRLAQYSPGGQAAAGHSASIRENSLTVRLTKTMTSLTLSTQMETGQKSNFNLTGGYRVFSLSGLYTRKGISLGLDLKSTKQDAGARMRNPLNLNRTWTFSYTPTSGNYNLKLGWKRDDIPDSINNHDVRRRFEARFQTRFQNGDSIQLSYSANRFQSMNDDALSLVYSKNVSLRIPYKRFGSVSGIVFEDRNRNGRYDDGDIPIENATVQLGQSFQGKTNATGAYEIFDVAQGLYELSVVSSSLSAALSQDTKAGVSVKVKSGKEVRIDIPLLRGIRIGGRIITDTSDYFSVSQTKQVFHFKVNLIKDGQVVAHAYSDEQGAFYFEGIAPGEYVAALDPGWLPSGLECLGSMAQSVTTNGEGDIMGLSFTVGPERVETIKTFQGQ